MIPFKTSITLDRKSKQPLYLQIANELIRLIKSGILVSGAKLPGSRTLATILGVHRKTVISGYDELLLQGWIVSVLQKGMFVHEKLPLLKQLPFSDSLPKNNLQTIGFSFQEKSTLNRPDITKLEGYSYINDGVSDTRLSPMAAIAKEYRSLAAKKATLDHLGYGSTYGNLKLRKVLTDYLNQTRGLNITLDQILITRGSQMGLYLSSQILFNSNEYVIVGETNYIAADLTMEHAGAKIIRVPVDDNGLCTDHIESLCKKHTVKAVYVTPHHHHPTTVTLSAKRRMHLLNLAKAHHFAIIEDDYDYDFNYDHAPILPLASHDRTGNVIYIGSICKTIAPVYRIGYLVAPKAFVDQCAKLRRIVDRQGDALLEIAFANYIKNGNLDRHIKKVLRIYRMRRNHFCKLLQQELGAYIQFNIPKGGMAVWACLHKKYHWKNIALEAKKLDLIVGDWQRYDYAHIGHNGIRIGFASYNETEMEEVVQKLKTAIEQSYPQISF